MNVFELFAKISLDTGDYNKNLSAASTSFSSFGNLIGKTMENAGKLVVAGVGAAATAAVTLGTASVKSYAQYEQLEGGVKKLFGTSSTEILKYANNAYATAGMSANTYLDTVTSFSASLINGLGGDTTQAAKISDMAIQDMADNANTFGTDIDSLRYTYSGFAKNIYTMLDNLKLGYGGTAGEMAKLVNDSGVLGDTFVATAENINDVSFDKIIEAIHKIQENNKITGTTATEASSTISGSASSMKASWSNLVTSLANGNSDLGANFDTFVDTAGTFAGNVWKRIKILIPRMKELVILMAEKIKENMPYIKEKFNEALPYITEFLDGLKTKFKEWLAEKLPEFIESAKEFIKSVFTSMWDALPEDTQNKITGFIDLLQKIAPIIVGIVAAFMTFNTITSVIQGVQGAIAAVNLVLSINPIILIISLIAGLVAALIYLWNTNEGFRQFLTTLFAEVWAWLVGAGEWVATAFQSVITWITTAWANIVEFFTNITTDARTLKENIITWITTAATTIATKFTEISNGARTLLANIWEWIANKWAQLVTLLATVTAKVQQFLEDVKTKISEAKEAIVTKVGELKEDIRQKFEDVVQAVRDKIEDFKQVGRDLISGLWDGIQEKIDWLSQKVSSAMDGISSTVKGIFGIQSPSKVFAEIGSNLVLGLNTGWNEQIGKAGENIQKSSESLIPELSTTGTNTNNTQSSGNKDTYFGDIIINLTSVSENAEEIAKQIGSQLQRQLRMSTIL